MTDLELPLIDVSGLTDDGPKRDAIVAAIGAACEEWGFFQITGHGLDSEAVERMFEACRQFFELDKEAKQSVRRTDANSKGYFDAEYTKQKIDWKEVFDFGAQQGELDASGLDGRNQWPDEQLPAFRALMSDYFGRVYQLSQRLFHAILDSLPSRQRGFINNESTQSLLAAAFARHSSFMRLNHYPRCPRPDDELGISPHTDSGALTVLAQTPVASLQVFHRGQGAWITVPPRALDVFVVNIGDIVQVLSNDLYRAPLHRVLAQRDSERYSVPFFLNPDYDYTYRPLVEPPASPKFRPINWGEFRLARSAGDYADLGEEIQISHYRIE